jgi:sugar lactone lactonase YvrE
MLRSLIVVAALTSIDADFVSSLQTPAPPGVDERIRFPSGLTLDRDGNIIVADRAADLVFRIDARTNAVTVVAGTGTRGWSGDGGPATRAQFTAPEWVEFDVAGNLIVADRGNHRVRRIDRAGIITHVAGTGVLARSADGPAATSGLTNPLG